jgi:hypothetical protein
MLRLLLTGDGLNAVPRTAAGCGRRALDTPHSPPH